MKWERFKQMDSARLFLMRGGDALFMPAGTFHYVYTVHTKLVVAGDYLTAVGWRTRVQSMERDLQVLGVRPEIASMATIFKKGVLLTAKQLQESVDRQGEQPARCGAVVSAKGGRLVVGGADDAATREAERRKRELVCILEWADALKAEARGYECAVTGEQGERRPLSRASQSMATSSTARGARRSQSGCASIQQTRRRPRGPRHDEQMARRRDDGERMLTARRRRSTGEDRVRNVACRVQGQV